MRHPAADFRVFWSTALSITGYQVDQRGQRGEWPIPDLMVIRTSGNKCMQCTPAHVLHMVQQLVSPVPVLDSEAESRSGLALHSKPASTYMYT